MNSNFLDSAEAIFSNHGKRFSALCGQRLTDVWVVWDKDDNSWFADEPVVLTFGDTFLTLVFWKSHEVAIEWDALDFSEHPNWFGCYDDLNLEWRPCETAAVRESIGQTLQEVLLIENRETLKTVVDERNPSNVDATSSDWLPYALSFSFERSVVTVFNALDENGLSSEIPVAEYLRVTPLSTK